MSGVTCTTNFITPEDFLKKVIRTDGAGHYALAVNDLSPITGWTSPINCGSDISWEDVIMLIYDQTKNAVNIVVQP